MKGYMGKLLRVNLTDRQVSGEPLDPKLVCDCIGGAELGVRLAYDEIPPETDPLGPDSKLIMMTGPVTATRLGTAGRYEVVYKAPLTGILCDASSGGHWGAEFKWAGYDGLILERASKEPVYLYINDGQAMQGDYTGGCLAPFHQADGMRRQAAQRGQAFVAIAPFACAVLST
jgi:aldehyde:ferredoxin oxidoreductase